MKLIVDWWNGGRWQWRYWSPSMSLWFDYGPAFDSRIYAEQWMQEQVI